MSAAMITGASGFIGGHLCRALADLGVEVVAVSRPDSAVPPRVRAHRRSGWDVPALTAVVSEERPGAIFHLVGRTAADDAGALYEANTCFGARLFEATLASGARPRVVVAGSAAEYGPPRGSGGRAQEADACRPVGAYGISKLAQTHHALAAARRGLSVVVARLFNPIGRGSPATSALGSFVRQVHALPRAGGALVTGPLDAVRDFSDVEAVVGVLAAMGHEEGPVGIVNVASGAGLRLADVVARLIALAPVPVRHEVEPSRGGTSDLDVVVADVSRLRALGLEMPPPDIDAVLRRMLEVDR